jgi:hypothetical protein
MQSSPPVLAEAPPPGVDPEPARTAWESWAKLPDAGKATGAASLDDLADAGIVSAERAGSAHRRAQRRGDHRRQHVQAADRRLLPWILV